MPRAKHSEAEENPDREVRFPVVIRAEDRHRLRAVAAILRRTMEDLAGEWVQERLDAEEKRLRIPKPDR